MAKSNQNNKRIAKNTIFLYIRMLLVMVITLYTSRITLDVLGVCDYGINNIVGGLATSFVFFSSSLSNATQRYLSFEMGKNDIEGVRKVFNLSLLIYIAISIIVFVLLELIGMWFIENKLVIPDERMEAATWVFQCVSIGLLMSLIGTVFESVLIARENMKLYAYMGILEVIMKLLIAYSLMFIDWDKLKLFALLQLFAVCLVRMIPVVYCFRKYAECKLKFSWDLSLFSEMFKFVFWNGIGTAVYAVNDQGINILLNLFFGPVINAARGVCMQVSGAISNFSGNFLKAIQPQVTMSYAEGDKSRFVNLFFSSSRLSYYLLWVLCIPVMFRIDYILSIWLVEVPEFTDIFIIWTLMTSLVNVLIRPIDIGIQAVGNLKTYMIIASIVFVLVFPFSYILLKISTIALIVFQVMFVFRVIGLFAQLKVLIKYVDFSVKDYLLKVIRPIIITTIVSTIVIAIVNAKMPQDFIHLIIFVAITLIVNCITVYVFGVSRKEKELIKDKLHFKHRKI